ncbi:MAG: c-type cytochrome [Bacteroidia bacterium]
MNAPLRSVSLLLFAVSVFTVMPGCKSGTSGPVNSFQLHPEFELSLVASEPLIFDPVDMAFDEKGRMFVLEMPGYPMSDAEGKIIMLEDENDDGIFDKRIVYADSLGVAPSLMPYEGGFLVASPPNLLLIKDTDGDNRADFREVLISGFSYGNLQHNFNGLTYGLDNWIYIANGGNSGNIYLPESPDEKHSIRGYDLKVDLHNNVWENIGRTSGGFELAMDDWGNFFGTHNTEHISHIVFPEAYISGLSLQPANTLDEISDHSEGDLARIYPIGRQDTRVNHPEQAGYFSGSCGITYYGGNAFPEGFNGNIFVADVVLNLIHRDVIHPKGPSFTASRNDTQTEFLASTDRSFRPVNMTTGPDGALYVVDMHRKVIEHPEWIPDEIEDTLDLNAGKDQGRIYRITPQGGLPRVTPTFDKNDLASVVNTLAHTNQWYRMTAQRLLVEWQDRAAVPLLETFFRESPSPDGRLHALWTLRGIGEFNESIILAALDDTSPEVRANAVKMAEPFRSDEMLSKILTMQEESNPTVVMQLLLSLSTLPYPEAETAYPMIHHLMETASSDQWLRMGIVAAAKTYPVRLTKDLLTDRNPTEGKEELLEMLARQDGKVAEESEIAALLQQANQVKNPLQVRLLNGLSAGIPRREKPLKAAGQYAGVLNSLEKSSTLPVILASWQLRKTLDIPLSANSQAMIQQAEITVRNSQANPEERVENLALIAYLPFSERENLLYELLNTRDPQALQLAAIGQIREAGGTAVAEKLIALWPTLGPATKNAAGNILLYQRGNHELLLTALETGKINPGEMNFHLERRRTLLFSEDESVRKRAEALFSDAGVFTRKNALDNMRPALALQGNPANGKLVFQQNCATCHQRNGEGNEVGPNLTEIYRKSGETLLHDIIDPNAAADTKYISHTIETQNQEIIAGIISVENDREIVLRQMNGVERTIPRADIKSFTSSGLSLMPEGLENAIDVRQMADLLAFLQEYPAN